MTSLLYSSGLNYQGGNPLGRKVRALETEIVALRKEIDSLKAGGLTTTVASQQTNVASSSFNADVEYLKREIAIIKAAGYGKGEKGDKGDKGDKGERGEPGPMTYIAMPSVGATQATTTVSST